MGEKGRTNHPDTLLVRTSLDLKMNQRSWCSNGTQYHTRAY